MRARPVAIASALLLLLIGGTISWLIISIPNDIRAESILRQARLDLEAGRREEARSRLLSVVENYPRTDAAATSMSMLLRMAAQDRSQLQRRLDDLARAQAEAARTLETANRSIARMRRNSAPQPTPTLSPSPTPTATTTPRPTPKPTPKKGRAGRPGRSGRH